MTQIQGEVDAYLKARINNAQLKIDYMLIWYDAEEVKSEILELIRQKQELVEMV